MAASASKEDDFLISIALFGSVEVAAMEGRTFKDSIEGSCNGVIAGNEFIAAKGNVAIDVSIAVWGWSSSGLERLSTAVLCLFM